MYSIQHYVIQFFSDLRQVGGFLRFPSPTKLTSRYSWNIVESGVKHHKLTHLFCRTLMFYYYLLYKFTHTGVQHYFNIRWCSSRLTVTRRVSYVEHELLSLSKHLSSATVFSGACVARSVLCSVFVLSSFTFGHYVVCHSSSDYPFGIFKLVVSRGHE